MKIIMEHHEKEDVKLLRMNFSMKNRHNKKKKEEGHSLRLKSEISKDNSLNDLFNLPAGKSEL